MTVSQERVAGLSLNAEVATRVMGWPEWDRKGDWKGTAPKFFACWGDRSLTLYESWSDDALGHFDPSADITDAMRVVEAMRAKASPNGCVFVLELDGDKNRWEAVFDMPHGYGAAQGMDNPALAICLASLAALDAETLRWQGDFPLSSSHTPDPSQ